MPHKHTQMENTIKPADKAFVALQIKGVPNDVYFELLDATNEEQKRFLGRKKCGLKDGLTRIIREYRELKQKATLAV